MKVGTVSAGAVAALALMLVFGLGSTPALAATIWTGPDLVVSQPADAPGTVTDVLVAGLTSLTRGGSGGLCNVLAGDGVPCQQPADLQFAFSGLNGNPAIPYGSAASYADYAFAGFADASEWSPGTLFPNGSNSQSPVAGVAHILSLDIYLDFEVQYWGQGPNSPNAEPGAFTYRRSTVPEPATAALLALGVAGLARLGTRRA